MTSYAALEHRFTVDCDDPDAAAYLAKVLVDLRSDGPAETTYVLRHVDGWFDLTFADEDVVRRTTRGHAVAMLLWHVNQECVRRTRPEAVVLHAAAVTTSAGAVVLPAPMEHGKTTTTTGLIRAGFAYLTDEAVAIDPDALTVRPFPKALSIDRGSWPLFPDLAPPLVLTEDQWQVPVSSFGTVETASAKVAAVVFPAYQEGATTQARPLSKAQALMRLCESTFAFPEEAPRNLPALGRLADAVPAFELQIGSLDEAVAAVKELVA